MSASIVAFQKLLFPDDPNEWDGVWGTKCKVAFEGVIHPTEIVHEETPTNAATLHWPKEADAEDFYGHSNGSSAWEDTHLTIIIPPFPMYMDGRLISKIRCHKLVAASLSRILAKIFNLYPSPETREAAGVDQYDGCYNYRNVRGASHLSMHAYGAAIDFDAAHNPLGATHGRMPSDVVALFKAEGWRWGGDYSGRKDWMHFEACS